MARRTGLSRQRACPVSGEVGFDTPPERAGRRWTLLGTLASPGRASVDDRGLVVPGRARWSLDWWIGAADRWHVAGHEASTRQRLIDLAPVTETAMRVPGGDAVHRAYAARPVSGLDVMVVIEVDNRSRAPFAVAFVVRCEERVGPHAGGVTLLERTVLVDGRPALYLPVRPGRSLAASSGYEELTSRLASVDGGWPEDAPPCPPGGPGASGVTEAAFVFPLAHSATIRLALPLTVPPGRQPRARRPPPESVAPPSLASLPPAAAVARSWQAHTRRGLQVELPAGRLSDAVQANRRFLLLLQDGSLADDARLLVALARWGFGAEARERAVALRTRLDPPAADRPGAQGLLLSAVAEHCRLSGDTEWARSLVDPVAAAAEWVERTRQARRRSADPARRGLPPSATYANACWLFKGLTDSVTMLRAAGEEKAAATAASWAGTFGDDLEESLGIMRRRLGVPAVPAAPAAPGEPVVPPDLATIEALCDSGLRPPDDLAVVRTLQAVREACGSGLAAEPALRLAAVEARMGDHSALDRLAQVVESASATFTWGVPSTGGHDPAVAVRLCLLVRDLLVRQTGDGLALCPLLPPAWVGQGLEVHDAPTPAGTLSFAVRWHGLRPALLWELHRRGPGPVRLRAPGLDPQWSTVEAAGDALLGAVSELPPPPPR